MIAAAVDAFRVTVRIELIVELEWLRARGVHCLDNVAELGGHPPRADELQVIRPATGDVGSASPPDHVHVELGDDLLARNGRMLGEPLRSQEPFLFGSMPHEEDRPLRFFRHRLESFGNLEDSYSSGAIVIGTVADGVPPGGAKTVEAVDVDRNL